MEIWYLIIGIVVGVLVGAIITRLVCSGNTNTARALLNAEKVAREKERQTMLTREQTLKDEYEHRLTTYKNEAASTRMREVADMRRDFDMQVELLRQQMVTLTEQLLKSRSEELNNENAKQLGAILAPLRQDIERMHKSMDETRDTSARNQAGIEHTIKLMMEHTTTLGQQAERLSNALHSQNKVTGNWGELILRELLESQGLVSGTHFEEQPVLRDVKGNALHNDDTGKSMQPDVILHLGDDREVIIDSKMSLKAYSNYQNAETDAERSTALKDLIESIRSHYRGLSGKRYNEYIRKPKRSVDFVIMFVPIDGALQLALNSEPNLWRDAFDKKVLIVNAQTLIAALHIIDLTWVNIKQERNTQQVMDEARKLVDRVDQFIKSFDSVGKKLTEATEAYNNVIEKVKTGRQSILGSGKALEELGIRGRKQLPQL